MQYNFGRLFPLEVFFSHKYIDLESTPTYLLEIFKAYLKYRRKVVAPPFNRIEWSIFFKIQYQFISVISRFLSALQIALWSITKRQLKVQNCKNAKNQDK